MNRLRFLVLLRFSLITSSLTLIIFLLLAASLIVFPTFWLRTASQFSPLKIEFKQARWLAWGHLEINQFKIKNEVFVKTLSLRFSPFKLNQGLIDSLSLEKPLWKISWEEILKTQKQRAQYAAKEFRRATHKQTKTTTAFSFPLAIKNIQINQGLVQFEDLGPGIPPLLIPLTISLKNLRLGKSKSDQESLQVIEIPDFSLYSPFDPQAHIFSFERLRIAFTVEGLLNQKIEEFSFIAPEIFIGQDLFWVTEYLGEQFDRLPKVGGASKPWVIQAFGIRGGAVTIATLGQPDFRLPLVFEAEQTNLVLTSFTDLHLKSRIRVPKVTLDYRERYNIFIKELEGELEFALPRNHANANNIVNQLKVKEVTWKELKASDLWLSVTFDENGIYGGFGGSTYEGYLNGQATLQFTNNFQWNLSLAASDVDLAPITQILSPDQVRITGKAQGKIVAEGHGRIVQEILGEFKMKDQGKVEIVSLDELLKKLPPAWSLTKQDLVKIFIQAFRDYHYAKGTAIFAYSPPLSSLKVEFDGKEGKRNFDLQYHHLPSTY